MKAMLLAAGKGTRLLPLTASLPKPLLPVGDKSLIEHHLVRLADAGFTEVVINVHHLGKRIERQLGDGSGFGVHIIWSREETLLETGGGVKNALSLLGEDGSDRESRFVLVSADTYAAFDFDRLQQPLANGLLGRLIMVANPAHHPDGDFSISAFPDHDAPDNFPNGRRGILTMTGPKLTWGCAGVFSPELFRDIPEDFFKLRKVFDRAVARGQLEGIVHDHYWYDVGTKERYESLLSDHAANLCQALPSGSSIK